MEKFLKGILLTAICLLCSQSGWAIGNNEIHYTTTDGCKIQLNEEIALGAKIISNNYENGEGVITFDRDITVLTESAFEGCTTLSSISLPNSVSTMQEAAFAGCEALTDLKLPTSVNSIGDYAFYGCSSLTHVSMRDTTTVGVSAFEGCICLTNIDIVKVEAGSEELLSRLR